MNKKLLISAVFIAFFATFSISVRAWDDAGHKLSAYIAWHQLQPEVREQVISILLNAPEDSDLNVIYNAYDSRSKEIKQLELFMYAATWSDVIRNKFFKVRYENYNNGIWHYSDIFWKQENGKPEILENFPEESGKAIPKLYDFEKTLRDSNALDAEKAIAIAWFLHVGGDIHNPLHNASRVTETEPKGDQGGNLFLLTPGDAKPRINLHGYWDSLITKNMPRENDACDAEYIPALGKKILSEFPFSKMENRLKIGDFHAWNSEGFDLLSDKVYAKNLVRGELPPKEYQAQAFALAREELALAGYRLGETLNDIFGDKSPKVANCKIIQRVMYPVSQTSTPDQKLTIALLNLCPPNKGKLARPMIPFLIDGKSVFFEYDVERVFKTPAEALKYAKDNDISDVTVN